MKTTMIAVSIVSLVMFNSLFFEWFQQKTLMSVKINQSIQVGSCPGSAASPNDYCTRTGNKTPCEGRPSVVCSESITECLVIGAQSTTNESIEIYTFAPSPCENSYYYTVCETEPPTPAHPQIRCVSKSTSLRDCSNSDYYSPSSCRLSPESFVPFLQVNFLQKIS
jgi:hypothetical protein